MRPPRKFNPILALEVALSQPSEPQVGATRQYFFDNHVNIWAGTPQKDPRAIDFLSSGPQRVHQLVNRMGLYTWSDSIPSLLAGDTTADLKLFLDDTTPATFCQPETTTTTVGVTSYTLDASILQDPHISDGISAYLFEHDTKAAYFYLGLADADAPPKAVGIVRLVAGQIGGEVRVTLTADISLPVERKPDLWVGNATTNRVIHGDGTAVTTFNAPASKTTKQAASAEG